MRSSGEVLAAPVRRHARLVGMLLPSRPGHIRIETRRGIFGEDEGDSYSDEVRGLVGLVFVWCDGACLLLWS